MSFGGGGFGQGSFWTGSQDISEATAQQIATLQAKLDKRLGPEYISTRAGAGGMKLTYVEGWKAINLANEVFGFHGWSSSITSLTVDFIDYNEQSQRYNIGVTAIIRVTLRDGAFHEDVGYGSLENAKQKGPALDKCKKEAVTDGIKRALRNFGNVLGNCLYDKSYTSEVVKIKVPPPKFDRSVLHRRPEFDESPQPQAGPSKAPPLPPSIASVAGQVRTNASAPARPSPLAQSTTNGVQTRGQVPDRSAAAPRPAPVPLPEPKGKEKDVVKAMEVLGEPEASSTQQYFGSDDDEAAFANFEVGVEEGCMEEESVFLAVVDDGMEVEGSDGEAAKTGPEEVTPPPPAPAVVQKPPSSGGSKSGGSTTAVNSRLEMMRQAIAQSNNASVPASKSGGAGMAGHGTGASGRVHSVGGFHFPDGMDMSGRHRSLQPTGAVPPGPSGGPPPPGPPGAPPSSSIAASSGRFMELLDFAKQEYDQVSSDCLSLKQQRDEYESRVGVQLNELGIIRQALYELEAQHGKIRQQYEAELQALRAELAAVQHHPPPPPLHPNQGPPSGLGLSSVPPPPHAAHGPPPHPYPPPPPSSSTASSDPYYPPSSKGNPPQGYRGHPDDYPPHLAPGKRARDDRADRSDAMQIDQPPERVERDRDVRERERGREWERERDMRERDRELATANQRPSGGKKSSKAQPPPPGAEREQLTPARPASTTQNKTNGPPTPYERESQPNGPPQSLPAHLVPPAAPASTAPIHGPAPPPGFIRDRYQEDVKTDIAERERERERAERAERDREDRERNERERRERERNERERAERDRAAASAAPPPAASSTSTGAALPPASSTSAPVPVAPTPTPTEQTPAVAPTSPTTAVSAPAANSTAANGTTSTAVTTTTGSSSQLTMATLTDLDPEQVPPELKKEGSDWFAIFNPQAQRKLDISLTLSLTHESVVCCVRFSADGKFLATGCNRTAQIYDTKTGAKTCTLSDDTVTKNGDLYIRSVCFSPDGKLLATGAEDKQIRIWDIASRTIRQVFSGHHQEIYSLDFSRDGRVIVSGSGDKTARVWNMETGAHQTLSILEPDNVDAGVTSVAISPDGQLVAAGSLDTIVRIWDVTTGNLIERLRGHLDSVYSVAFTPDGKGLVSGSLDKTLKYWDLSPLLRNPNRTQGLSQGGSVPSGQQPVTNEGGEKGSTCSVAFSGHKDYVLSVAVSPDGAWVVSGSKDRGVQFWDPRTGLTQLMLQGHKNSVISIDLSPVASPSGGLLASGSGDWIARVWSYTPVP